jgi:hypothetical protein
MLIVLFKSSLTNSGGTVGIATAFSGEATCLDAACSTATPGTARTVTDGSVVASALPATTSVPTLSAWLMAALALLLAGLGLISLRRMRRHEA